MRQLKITKSITDRESASLDKYLQEIATIDDIKSTLENKKGGVLIEGIYPNGMRAYYGFGM